MKHYTHILAAIDLTSDSKAVIARAQEQQQCHGARLSLIHVVEPVPIDMPTDFVLPERMELEEYVIETSEERLKEIAKETGIDEDACALEVGSARSEITRYAKENKVDLVVIGSHGRHGLQLLLGSTANAVLHIAPCDVLAVRVRQETQKI